MKSGFSDKISEFDTNQPGDIDQLIKNYADILASDPNHYAANYNMGLIANSLGGFDSAILFFEKTINSNPSESIVWEKYIDSLIKSQRINEAQKALLFAKSKGASGQIFKTLQNHIDQILNNKKKSKIVNYSSNIPTKYLRNLQKLLKFEKYTEAINLSETLLEKFPKSIDVFKLQGFAYAMLGNYDASVNAFNSLLELNASLDDIHFEKGCVLIDAGKTEFAIKSLNKAIEINPRVTKYYHKLALSLKKIGEIDLSISILEKALLLDSNHPNEHFNMGNSLMSVGRWSDAIKSFTIAIKLAPDFFKAYHNKGVVYELMDDFESAKSSFNKAIKIDPNFIESYNNLGLLQMRNGDFVEAKNTFQKAIDISPDFPSIHNNYAILLREKGELNQALYHLKKSISLKHDFSDAYNNLGLVYQDKGLLKDAIFNFKMAIKFNQNISDAYWNLYGCSVGIKDAIHYLTKCLTNDPENLEAKLTLEALNFYDGNKSNFISLANSSLKNHPYMRSFLWVFSLQKKPKLFFDRFSLFDYAIEKSVKERPFYEYGVWRGESFRYLIKTYKLGYGFDTFDGLPEIWHNKEVGSYSSDGNIPNVEGGHFIVGNFEETLPEFFSVSRQKASLINFDADLYSSTISALMNSKSIIDEHTVLVFDEFLMNPNWEKDEYQALIDFCSNNDYLFEILAVSFFSKQVVVKISHNNN